jgi:hypothetical protein
MCNHIVYIGTILYIHLYRLCLTFKPWKNSFSKKKKKKKRAFFVLKLEWMILWVSVCVCVCVYVVSPIYQVFKKSWGLT